MKQQPKLENGTRPSLSTDAKPGVHTGAQEGDSELAYGSKRCISSMPEDRSFNGLAPGPKLPCGKVTATVGWL